MALDDANGQSCFWGPQGTALGNYPVNEYDEKIPVELSNVENADWNGYAYTQNMKAAALRKEAMSLSAFQLQTLLRMG